MRKPLSGATCLSRPPPGKLQVIWITDAVLAETFRRFTHATRRYGSNVPGPLESRRRASKRKNASLAYQAGSATPVDPAVLLPIRPQNSWWQKQSEPDIRQTESIFPRWLLPPPDPPSAFQYSHKDAEAVNPVNEEELFKGAINSLSLDYQQCKCVEDVHQLLTRHRIDLRRSAVTNDLFASLLPQWNPTEIAIYVTDPGLNPPGTNNHVQLASFLRDQIVDTSATMLRVQGRPVFIRALCRAIRLGLVGPQELEKIVEIFSLLPSDPHSPHEQLDAICQFLQSLRDSNILAVDDLSLDLRRSLITKIEALSPTPSTFELLRLLCQSIPIETNIIVGNMICSWIIKGCEIKDLFIADKIRQCLLSLPELSVASTVSSVTEGLALACEDRDQLQAFWLWSEILESVRGTSVARMCLEQQDFEQIRAGFSSQSTPLKVSLMSNWIKETLTALADADKINYRPTLLLVEARQQLDAELSCNLSTTLRLNDGIDILDWLAEINNSIQYLPFRRRPAKLERIASAMTDNLLELPTAKSLPTYNASISLTYLQRLADDAFYSVARKFFMHELMRMCDSLTADPKQFLSIAQVLVETGGEHDLKAILRALKNSRGFLLGLKHGRPNIKWREVDMMENIAAVRFASQVGRGAANESRHDTIRRLPSFPVLLDMIDRIAVLFATNPHDSPQTAFNRVRQCRRFLRRHHLKSSPVIARTYYHAGIARRQGAKTSTTSRREIFKVLYFAEGSGVAHALTNNPDFRAHRRSVLDEVYSLRKGSEEDEDEGVSKSSATTAPDPQVRQVWDEMIEGGQTDIGTLASKSVSPSTVPTQPPPVLRFDVPGEGLSSSLDQPSPSEKEGHSQTRKPSPPETPLRESGIQGGSQEPVANAKRAGTIRSGKNTRLHLPCTAVSQQSKDTSLTSTEPQAARPSNSPSDVIIPTIEQWDPSPYANLSLPKAKKLDKADAVDSAPVEQFSAKE